MHKGASCHPMGVNISAFISHAVMPCAFADKSRSIPEFIMMLSLKAEVRHQLATYRLDSDCADSSLKLDTID